MAVILFFDDWAIQHSHGLERRWFRAEPWPGTGIFHDPALKRSFHELSIIRDEPKGSWRMWSYGLTHEGRSGKFLYTSNDGLNWSPADCGSSRKGFPNNLVFTGNTGVGGACVVKDEIDPDAQQRYKMVYVDTLPGQPDKQNYGQIAISADGIQWHPLPGSAWANHHVDTFHCTRFNPFTQRWQWTSRMISGDRRIALYQTSDFHNFHKPDIIIHPDPDDPPCVEFYGMPHFFYGDHAVGFLWRMHSSFDEVSTSHRMRGKVDNELVYSVNGLSWNRTNRECLTPDYGFGPDCPRCVYPQEMVLDDDGWLRIYSSIHFGEHADNGRCKPDEPISSMTISRLRRDGFCALETSSDTAFLTLRPLVSRGGQITLNAVTARFGSIRAELCSVPDNTPIPGFEMDNSLPVEGDGHFLPLRWKERDSIDAFRDQPFRLHLRLDRARLYAVRTSSEYLYESHIHLNQAGNFLPDANPEFFSPNRSNAYPRTS